MILSDSFVTTRARHPCWGCRRPIRVGATVHRIVYVDLGKADSVYWCPVCEELIARMDIDEDDRFEFGELRQNESQEWERVRGLIEAEGEA